MTSVVENVRPTVEELELCIRTRRRANKKFITEVDRRYFCPDPICSEKKKWFVSQKKLNQHYSKVHAKRELNCRACKRTFALERDLRYHEKQHTLPDAPEKPHATRVKVWTCNFCNKSFNRRYELNDHIRAEHESHEKRYECSLCECSFETEDEVEGHFKEMHPEHISFNVGCSSNKEQPIEPELQSIMSKYPPIQPKPDAPTSHHLEPHSENVLPWLEETYASTQTEYNSTELTSSYSQTDLYYRCDHSAPVQYAYDYNPVYMERQDFGSQTYYAETHDFGAQIGEQSPQVSWCPMEVSYEDECTYGTAPGHMMDSGLCHVGTTSYYSDWTRHTETQTDEYYNHFEQTPLSDPMVTFSNGSTQTTEVTYNNQMV
ncbi:hypothetical protein QR680_002351 [Steinernema hermaphroditum]|uniref:C2H2-type domain-containing protein n=1 Tax=Steinernema hermaphroditum TaxID=289476 RepID=A0AA39H4J1_9BILA|nr:hypothetical protein QR680_002351 [Steinernema hermaphroditum]